MHVFYLDCYNVHAHISVTPMPPLLAQEGQMPYFCHQISYTTDAWNRVVRNPQNRFDPIRVPIENLGGTIHASFFTAGNYDLLVISEFPENVSSSSIAVAFSTGGAVACIQTTPLLSASQAIESWRKSNFFNAAPAEEHHAYHVMAAAAGS
jgi:uncharacterized protein with GYD domain